MHFEGHFVEESTCWTMIDEAARGNPARREEFAVRYLTPVRSYLLARWKSTHYLSHLDDAVQEVFVECFRSRGVIEKADVNRPGGFRAYLFGLVRNVARVMERRQDKRRDVPGDQDPNDSQWVCEKPSLSVVFDRAWAQTIMQQAAQRQKEKAKQLGEAALRRVELLRLRFQDGCPIRVIAQRWQMNPETLHREYARARQEFKQALLEVIAFHSSGSVEDPERECQELLSLLQ